MSQDIVADALNQIMNAKRARHTSVKVKHHSKLLLSILAIAKLKGYVKAYIQDQEGLRIEFAKLNGCNAIKPRFIVQAGDYEVYVKRYLPAKHIGVLVVSTPEGIMTHQTAQEKNKGGSLLAYFY